MKRYFVKGNSLVGGDVDGKALKLKGYEEITKHKYDELLREYLRKAEEESDGDKH